MGYGPTDAERALRQGVRDQSLRTQALRAKYAPSGAGRRGAYDQLARDAETMALASPGQADRYREIAEAATTLAHGPRESGFLAGALDLVTGNFARAGSAREALTRAMLVSSPQTAGTDELGPRRPPGQPREMIASAGGRGPFAGRSLSDLLQSVQRLSLGDSLVEILPAFLRGGGGRVV
jgi:hypothetical protein